eukprot:NODE_565_length_1607_cov_65.009628_g464_i0.p1 GENE.NODE_565_length_1607_cov_65.009628_g464_i0~~NODE_565_length_1607_cov_65.009628_g464_i0.p1  ORF type:complete len:176 (-),score=25.93 NODE_565_length_1607_cov_65.009628_g464_i0:606-1133(-)
MVYVASSMPTTAGATLNFKAYDAPTRGITSASTNLQESNPLFAKGAEEQNDDSKIKLKNVKQKWGENMEEEEKKKEEAKKAAAASASETGAVEESFKKVQGSFGQPANPQSQPQSKKEDKKVSEKLEANKGLFQGMFGGKKKESDDEDSDDSDKVQKKEKVKVEPATQVSIEMQS